MSEPFLGELKLVSFNFAPRGWAVADGQLLPINQNQALFALLGTTYGGNGQTTFALPDLRGRVARHVDSAAHPLGQRAGSEAVTLTLAQLPAHTHAVRASSAPASAATASGATWAAQSTPAYGTTPVGTMRSDATTSAGGSQAHNNMQPSLVLTWIIALQGIFPSRN